MRITRIKKGGESIISVSGSLETGNDTYFLTEVNNFIIDSSAIILNFEYLDFISSAGLYALLAVKKECDKKKIALKIINANEVVKEVFNSTGFDQLIEINK